MNLAVGDHLEILSNRHRSIRDLLEERRLDWLKLWKLMTRVLYFLLANMMQLLLNRKASLIWSFQSNFLRPQNHLWAVEMLGIVYLGPQMLMSKRLRKRVGHILVPKMLGLYTRALNSTWLKRKRTRMMVCCLMKREKENSMMAALVLPLLRRKSTRRHPWTTTQTSLAKSEQTFANPLRLWKAAQKRISQSKTSLLTTTKSR